MIPRNASPSQHEAAADAPTGAGATPDDDDRDTLVSNRLEGSGEPPVVVELSIELPEAEHVVDPSERVLEALEQSLRALGWRPTVMCARRHRRCDADEDRRR